MTIKDSDLCRLCASSYDPSAAWDQVWSPENNGGIWMATVVSKAIEPGRRVWVFRASITLEDWRRDGWALIENDPVLGRVHAGFNLGMPTLFQQVHSLIGLGDIVTGHSLGGARALLFAARAAAAGISLGTVVTFGAPRPGCQELEQRLGGTLGFKYVNRHDPVPHVPFAIPGFPYEHPYYLSEIDGGASDELSPLCDHHISRYITGVEKREAVVA